MQPTHASPSFTIQRLFPHVTLTIQAKILIAFLVVVSIMGGLNALFIVQSLRYQQQYDTIINNIATANYLLGYVKPAVDSTLWEIVAGKQRFENGTQYQIIDEVTSTVVTLEENTDSDKGRLKLDVILRTLETLEYYVDVLGEQISQDSTFDENMVVLENIRGVSDVLQETLQEYMLFEVNRTEQKYQEMRSNFNRWAFANLVALVLVIVFSIMAAWMISSGIYSPIKKLHDVTAEVTREDLNVLIAGEETDELTQLGLSFDLMRGKIRELLDSKLREQENLKKYELRALQAQINPHFLYNTLDSIIWMAKNNQNDQAIELVLALSNFFRISLSKGMDWIPIKDEIEHVRSYLAIQKIRYRDILEYQIDVDPEILDGIILKLTLQPLVENAIYHGIKNKRGGGKIIVQAKRHGKDQVRLVVQDNGIGFNPDILKQLNTLLRGNPDENDPVEEGYGIYSVNRRIKLFYGRQYGVEIASSFEAGTCVSLTIPYRVGKFPEENILESHKS